MESGDTVPQGVGTSLYGDLAFLFSAPYHAVHLLFRVRCKDGHFINLFICKYVSEFFIFEISDNHVFVANDIKCDMFQCGNTFYKYVLEYYSYTNL